MVFCFYKHHTRRYERFKRETNVMRVMENYEGIMKVFDRNCPQGVPQNKDEAWFLMPKAKNYKVNRNSNIFDKINDMLQLAYIIQSIHKRGLAHRDIKPENILILNGSLILSDFGLIWEDEELRLTEINDKIGSYKILPPELEKIQLDMLLDFRASDVYLFSKVLWMTLKEDNIGFRGQYYRGDIQIYLDKDVYNVVTLEPIHKLMEESTYEDMNKRITIERCIYYLELQIQVLEECTPGRLTGDFVRQLQYEENSKEMVSRNKPNELVYEDKHSIYDILGKIIPVANIYVGSFHDKENITQIQITDFKVSSNGICQLSYYYTGKRMREYLLIIKKLTYSKQKELMILDLEDFDDVDREYISFNQVQRGFENMYSKIYFTSYEQIIITKPC